MLSKGCSIMFRTTTKPSAVFDRLPVANILTLGIDAHPSWVVTPKDSVHDLDNIKLDKPGISSVDAGFELENILVEGHCFDAATSGPPRGLQFVLGTATSETDTIVMANLGYFQFQSNPGVLHLKVREGRSRELYHIQSVEKIDASVSSEAKLHEQFVPMNTFEGTALYVKVCYQILFSLLLSEPPQGPKESWKRKRKGS
jgi:UDP-glucose:glycoprotein glucosyltransferase